MNDEYGDLFSGLGDTTEDYDTSNWASDDQYTSTATASMPSYSPGWTQSGDFDFSNMFSGNGDQYFDDYNVGSNLGPGAGLQDIAPSLVPQQQAQPGNPLDNIMGKFGPKIDEATQRFLSNPDRWMGDLMKFMAATQEQKKNKKYANSLSQIASSPMMDPFGSQRGVYQEQMKQATLDPQSVPMIKQNLEAIQAAQDRKDAAAGRRSNQVGSAPAVLAAQNQSVLDYIKAMSGPAGANINPNSSGYADVMLRQALADAQGNSPLYSAAGNILQGHTADNRYNEYLDALKKAGLIKGA